MARFLFIWMVMIGAMIGVREGTHFEVDVWPDLGPRADGAAAHRLGRLRPGVRAGVRLVGLASSRASRWNRISELAELPLWMILMAWPVAGFTWVLFLGESFVDDFRMLRGGARPHDAAPRCRRGWRR